MSYKNISNNIQTYENQQHNSKESMWHRKKSTSVTRKCIENENTAYENLCYLIKTMLRGSLCLYMLIIEKKTPKTA